ncbi:nuclear transport factor 2 isoform 1-T1 [Pholidichthys leucotaenia]
MADQPLWEQIGSSFVQHYYQLFDSDRSQLGSLYIDASCLSWEGQQYQGKDAIVEKLNSLPFKQIAHSITAQDHQPTPDQCILSMVVGQLKIQATCPPRHLLTEGPRASSPSAIRWEHEWGVARQMTTPSWASTRVSS